MATSPDLPDGRRSRVGRWLPRTLTARLVAILVALVAVVALLIGALTVVVMQQYLIQRLDAQVSAALDRVGGDGLHDPDHDQHPPGMAGFGMVVQRGSCRQYNGPMSPGTLLIGQSRYASGVMDDYGCLGTLDAQDYRRVLSVAQSGGIHTVEVPGVGDYRVSATSTPTGNVVGVGMSMAEIHRTIGRLGLWSSMLGLTAVLLTALAGSVLVRRQLRPLRTVAATAHAVTNLPLDASGETISTRVPARLTDPDTEVGQVGAALNNLLDHVDSAFDARHRSELQVRQFVADASHELRTPLATIHGYAELSRRTPEDAPALAHAMGKVETEAHRMSSLVDDLLLLARLDAGRPLDREEVDVTRLLLEAVADAKVVAPDHFWKLDLPDEPVTVTGDEQRLHQVVTNLINNARRHTAPGTTVTVGAHRVRRRVDVSVHDTGEGMTPELVGRAFERFTRGDSSRTRDSGGAGLGLSLVQAISEAHGGSAEVHSAPGSTTFTVHLPQD